MKEILVNANKPYKVLIGEGIMKDTGKFIKEIKKPCKVGLISDDIVSALYMDNVKKSLEEEGFGVYPIVFKHGEEHKNLETVGNILSKLASVPLSRSDIVVALGGGITGDIGGFASACYLRGISYVNVPTTLLSQIDSSIGGKTACNLPEGKNLCGSFHNPSLVICDTEALKSLKEDNLKDGLGECIKYASAFDKSLFDLLKKGHIIENSEEIILKCLNIKKKVVEEDEKDLGERRKLNFGHTIGHGIEKCSNFKISHGQAVAIGSVMIEKSAYLKGLAEENACLFLIDKLKELDMLYEFDCDKNKLFDAALKDKKIKGNTLSLIVSPKLGESIIVDIDKMSLIDWL